MAFAVVMAAAGPGMAQTPDRDLVRPETGVGDPFLRSGPPLGLGFSVRHRSRRSQDNTNPYYVGNALGGDIDNPVPVTGPGSVTEACATGQSLACRAIDEAVTGSVGWTDCEGSACPTPRERARTLRRCDRGDLAACQRYALWGRRGYQAYRAQSDME
jgi:hypothetical protein